MKKLAIIANPKAGRGSALGCVHEANRKIWGRQCVFFYPSSAAELQSVCSSLDPVTYEGMVVIGGDGTMNQAIRSLRGKQSVPLFAFPSGTANDLARELGLIADWDQVQMLVDKNQVEDMDLIEVNGVRFATVAGTGIGALLTSEFNTKRFTSPLFRALAKNLTSQMYTLLSAKTVLIGTQYIHDVHVQSGNFNERIKAAAIFVCNQRYLSGNLCVAPQIENNDSRFNVLIVPKRNRLSLIASLIQLKRGQIPKDFILFSTDKLVIQELSGKKIKVFGDGETLKEDRRLEFTLLPRALRVYRAQSATSPGVSL